MNDLALLALYLLAAMQSATAVFFHDLRRWHIILLHAKRRKPKPAPSPGGPLFVFYPKFSFVTTSFGFTPVHKDTLETYSLELFSFGGAKRLITCSKVAPKYPAIRFPWTSNFAGIDNHLRPAFHPVSSSGKTANLPSVPVAPNETDSEQYVKSRGLLFLVGREPRTPNPSIFPIACKIVSCICASLPLRPRSPAPSCCYELQYRLAGQPLGMSQSLGISQPCG